MSVELYFCYDLLFTSSFLNINKTDDQNYISETVVRTFCLLTLKSPYGYSISKSDIFYYAFSILSYLTGRFKGVRLIKASIAAMRQVRVVPVMLYASLGNNACLVCWLTFAHRTCDAYRHLIIILYQVDKWVNEKPHLKILYLIIIFKVAKKCQKKSKLLLCLIVRKFK